MLDVLDPSIWKQHFSGQNVSSSPCFTQLMNSKNEKSHVILIF